jgi:hypothetical protein
MDFELFTHAGSPSSSNVGSKRSAWASGPGDAYSKFPAPKGAGGEWQRVMSKIGTCCQQVNDHGNIGC